MSPHSLRAAVVEAGEQWSNGQRRLIHLVTALDESGEWASDGSPTCAHWIADALDIELCTARDWLRVGKALRDLDALDRAFVEGRLSYSKVRALVRVATPRTQHALCELAELVPASRLGPAVAEWLTRHEEPSETAARQHAARRHTWRVDVDGTIVGSYRLPPVEAATLHGSVDARVRARRSDASADAWPSLAQQRADALVALARDGGSIVAEVVLHVRGDGCTLDDGTPIAGTVVERIAPQAFLRALIHDADRRPINASSRQRHPTSRQKRVVRERDRVCSDCGGTDLLEYDHEPPFEETGHTVVDELKTRCAVCHHRRHRGEDRAA